MRDYRGKRVDNGEWVYGYYIKYKRKSYILIPNAKSFLSGFIQVIPETVGQSIGQNDESGKKIYQGDKVKGDPDGGHSIVSWNNFVCAWCLTKNGVCLYPGHDTYRWERLKIIGNIHDPDLKEKT